jgi:hypothetical protein
VLRALIVMVALMSTTTAFAQEQCKSPTPWSYDSNRTESISDINRIMTRLLGRVELVPSEEADYIQKELAKVFESFIDEDRLNKLMGRRYYKAALLRKNVAEVMQEVEAAERATAQRDAAYHLIEILSDKIPEVERKAEGYFYNFRPYKQQAHHQSTYVDLRETAVSAKDHVDITMDIAEARYVAATVLRCIVKGL